MPSRSKGSIPISVIADRGLGPEVLRLRAPSFLKSTLKMENSYLYMTYKRNLAIHKTYLHSIERGKASMFEET